jgi:hypothetical protein
MVGSLLTLFIREYAEAMRSWFNSEKERKLGEPKSFPAIMAPLRRLTVAASSVLLDRFETTLRACGRTGLVGDMSVLREKGFTAHNLVPMVKRPGDPETQTGVEYLRFLTFGSPKLRFILYQIHTYVLPASSSGQYQKLMLTEAVPLSAHFWELVCNLTYVETAVLHSGLNEQERINLISRFNDPASNLMVLIIMYNVNAQGANLDGACNRGIVVTTAINAPLETQAYCRIIRVLSSYSYILPYIILSLY